jgi:hypothetical protein
MSKLVGDRLPASLMSAVGTSTPTEPSGQCLILVTTDPDGTPRPCLLSVGETLAVDDRHVRVVVWPDSATTRNLDRGGVALLVCAVAPDVFHIRADPVRMAASPQCDLARFELTVRTVEVDHHAGMPVTCPMTFAAVAEASDQVLAMWRTQHEALRS